MVEVGRIEAGLYLDQSAFDKGLAQAEGKANKFGSAIGTALKAGAAAGIAGTAAALVGGTKAFATYEQGLASVSKTTGLTGAELKNLGNDLRALSTQGPVTVSALEDIAGAAGSLGVGAAKMASGDIAGARAEIVSFTKTMSDMSVAFEMDAGVVATSMADIGNVFKIPTENLNILGSQINALENTMNATAPGIIDFMNSFGGTATMWGESESATAAFGATLSSLGVKGPEAATAIRSGLAMITSDGKKMAAMADIMGISTEELSRKMNEDLYGALIEMGAAMNGIEGDVEKAAAATDIFGTYGYQALAKLGGGADIYAQALKNVNVTGDELAAEAGVMANTLTGQWQRMKNSVFDVGISIGEITEGPVKNFLARLNTEIIPAVKNFVVALAAGNVDWRAMFSKLPNIAKDAFKKAANAAKSAWSGLSSIIGQVGDWIKGIDWSGIIQGLLSFMVTDFYPALFAIPTKIYDALLDVDWGGISAGIQDVFTGIDWDLLASQARESISNLWDDITDLGDNLAEEVASVDWGNVGHRILGGIKTVFGAAQDLGDYLADAIEGYDWSPVGETVAEWLKKGVQKGWDLLQWIGERVVGISQSDASSVYQPWFDAVIGAFSEFWSGFTDEVTGGKGWTVAFINVFWEAFDKVSDLLWRWGGNYYNSLRSQIIGWLTQVDAFAIEFANLFILSYDTVLIELGEFYLRATRGYSDLVKYVTTTLDKLGEVKSFDDLRSLAEGPMNYVKGLIDSLKSSVDDLINSLTKLASGDFSGISDIFSQKFNYTVVGRTSGDIYGHKSMTEAEAEQYQQEHPQFKLENQGPSQGLASTITNPFASIPYEAIDLTTNPVGSLAESGQLAEFTSIMDKLNSYQNPLASAIANNEEIGKSVLNVAKFWANPVAGAVGAATSRWYGSQFSNLQNFPTEGGQVDLSALYGKAQGSVMASAENPMLDYLISPIGINQEQQLANIKAMFPEWKGSDEELVSELSTIRSEVEAYASDSIEQQSTTAINTGSISSQMGAMPANLQGWLSSSSQQPQGAQPGQIISRESVAGFANAVIYAISPETGKLTAYIGSAGKQFEQSVGAGAAQIPAASQSFVRSVDKSVSSIYSGSKKSSAELIYGSSEAARQAIAAGAAANVSLRDGGYAALGSLVAGGQSVSSALTTSSQSAATSIISSAQTSGSILSNYSSISAGKILTSGESLGMIVSNSGYSWGNAVSSAAEVQKSATSESGATWKTAVDESGSTIRGAADSIGNAAGVVIGSLGSVLGGVANLVGGGYMSGGGSVSGTGYSAGGEDFGCEICTPMHGYNALIYTAPNGTTYAINPMTLQAQGGISGSIASGSAKVIGGYSSSKGSSSSKIISSSSSYKPILSHYSGYAEGGVVEGPQLALVGDNPSGREAIIPEEVWGGKGGAGDVTVIVEMDSRQIAKAVMPRAAKSIRIRTNSKVN